MVLLYLWWGTIYGVELTGEEEAALRGERGRAMETAYRILVATGEADGAERLIDIEWAHLSGVNYNTIGDAGEEFLSEFGRYARVRVKTSLNPMGYDIDSVHGYRIGDDFVAKQESIRESYQRMGVMPTFSCIPYEILALPKAGTHVAFAESNAAIYANSVAGLRTNKESSFSALASAVTGKSPYSPIPEDDEPHTTVSMDVPEPDELTFGLLGFFAGRVADRSVAISGAGSLDRRSCKSLCGGLGTSGTCSKFVLGNGSRGTERVRFGKEELAKVRDELNTADDGDMVTLGSPQLGFDEIADLSAMLKGRRFRKRCMVFCPRMVQEQARRMGHIAPLERAGCEILSDCCTCLTPLVDKREVDSVTTNSIKGAYYLKNSNGVKVNIKPLSSILQDETTWS